MFKQGGLPAGPLAATVSSCAGRLQVASGSERTWVHGWGGLQFSGLVHLEAPGAEADRLLEGGRRCGKAANLLRVARLSVLARSKGRAKAKCNVARRQRMTLLAKTPAGAQRPAGGAGGRARRRDEGHRANQQGVQTLTPTAIPGRQSESGREQHKRHRAAGCGGCGCQGARPWNHRALALWTLRRAGPGATKARAAARARRAPAGFQTGSFQTAHGSKGAWRIRY